MQYQEFMKKYGEEEVTFVSYYKYSFTFKNDKLVVGCGGSHDDIYRLAVGTKPTKIKDIEPTWARIDGEFYNFSWQPY